jgi:hypothetical protein
MVANSEGINLERLKLVYLAHYINVIHGNSMLETWYNMRVKVSQNAEKSSHH